MSHDTVGIAVAQFAPSASRAGNLADISDAARTAASRGARVVVFPEYSSYFVDPFDSSLAENAEDSPLVARRSVVSGNLALTYSR